MGIRTAYLRLLVAHRGRPTATVEVSALLGGDGGTVEEIALSPDGSRLAVCGVVAGRGVRVLSEVALPSGEVVARQRLGDHLRPAPALLHTGGVVIAAESSGVGSADLSAWNGSALERLDRAGERTGWTVSHAPDGFVAATPDKVLLGRSDGALERALSVRADLEIDFYAMAIACSPVAPLLAVGGASRLVVLDSATLQVVARTPPGMGDVSQVRFAGADRLFTIGPGWTLTARRLHGGALETLASRRCGPVYRPTPLPAHDRIAVDQKGGVRIFDATRLRRAGSPVGRRLVGPERVVATPSGRHIAVVTWGLTGRIEIFGPDVRAGEPEDATNGRCPYRRTGRQGDGGPSGGKNR